MLYQRSAAAFAILAACLVSAPVSAQIIDQNYYYKLSTEFRGSEMKLDVFNGGPKNNMTRLERDQDISGQFWRLSESPDGTFRLSSWFRPGMCLDIFNGGPNDNQPHLARCGHCAIPYWVSPYAHGAGRPALTGPRNESWQCAGLSRACRR